MPDSQHRQPVMSARGRSELVIGSPRLWNVIRFAAETLSRHTLVVNAGRMTGRDTERDPGDDMIKIVMVIVDVNTQHDFAGCRV